MRPAAPPIRTTLVTLGLAASLVVSGCGAFDRFPPEPYFETCTTDASCGPSFRCLPWTGFGAPRSVCTLPCVDEADCPSVVSDHCGDQTFCNDDGVCGYFPCR